MQEKSVTEQSIRQPLWALCFSWLVQHFPPWQEVEGKKCLMVDDPELREVSNTHFLGYQHQPSRLGMSKMWSVT